MTIYKYPDKNSWKSILTRPVMDNAVLEEKIAPIFQQIKKDGDKAVRKFTAQFDKADLELFEVTGQEKYFAMNQIDPVLFDAIKLAAENITVFHRKQIPAVEKIKTMPGVVCWRKNVPIEKVGLYIPGGTAPLFSTVLMLTIPAVLANCKEIIICSPPSPEGKIHPAIIAAAGYIGIKRIFKVGGAQAIAAMTFGTASIPKVDKIFGPGNQYVTAAKQMAEKYGMAIDMPAGPSEVAVYADNHSVPAFVAADLLSQAEHGADSQVVLVTDHEDIVTAVQQELEKQIESLPRKEFAALALKNSKAFVVNNRIEAINLLNEYAPEHLILSCNDAPALAEDVINAGSVFIGNYSPESVGDYASGTNHTLPTNGYARTYSGVSVDSFVKKITFQQLTAEGLDNIGDAVEKMAEAEGLRGHAEAVRVRRSGSLKK
ncbi:MAG: histidinol dehydrogenase [Chitinophagaceae bacterium]|nr:histidinol dehydrogenase [Chitinophagaceae bacterium]